MSTGYQIEYPDHSYFLTFTVVDWVDVFTRKIYRDLLIDSMDYCRKAKGLKIWGYIIMTNHMHCIWQAREGNLPDVIRDFKRFTAQSIIKAMPAVNESRMDWMLKRFEFAAKSNVRSSMHQFWEHNNHAELILTEPFFRQKLKYIHDNPVRAGWVENPSYWLYSSARNYQDLPGLLEIDLPDE